MGADVELTITYLTPERFFATKQIGLPIVQEWQSFARWLTTPTRTERDDKDAKKIAGAWCPCDLRDLRVTSRKDDLRPRGSVKDGAGPSQLLVADVDECGADGFDRSVAALSDYFGCVVTSCNATSEDARHRIVLVTDRLMLPGERLIAWKSMNRTLAGVGIAIDQTCKNANRLYYASVWKRGGLFRAAHLSGALVPVDTMLAAEHAATEAERAARPKPQPLKEENRDKYIAGAITKARANVENASAGARHHTLLQETYALARFGLSEMEIADALLAPFVHAAGEARRREGERAIHDAFAARRGAA